MVKLNSFRLLEPDQAEEEEEGGAVVGGGRGEERRREEAGSANGRIVGEKELRGESPSSPSSSSSSSSCGLREDKSKMVVVGQTSDNNSKTPAPQRRSISSARSMSIKSSSSSSSRCSSGAVIVGLTTDTGSVTGSISSAKLTSPQLQATELAGEDGTGPAPAIVSVRNNSDIRRPSNDGSMTLSSNEEFQSAQIDVNDDDDGAPPLDKLAEDAEAAAAKATIANIQDLEAPRENVTRIEIVKQNSSSNNADTERELEHNGANTAKHYPLVTTTMRLKQQKITMQQQQQQQQQQQVHQNSPISPRLLKSTPTMPRSQTSPSPLSQMVGKLPQLMRPSGGKLGASNLASGDSGSLHSLQYKYQGSNHFEIRWQNVRLFARPPSRLPNFISDNRLYKTLFSSNSSSSSLSLANYPDDPMGGSAGLYEDPFRPPYSPPLRHHKIPPTIDENLEMKCPNQEVNVLGLSSGKTPPITSSSSSSRSSSTSSSAGAAEAVAAAAAAGVATTAADQHTVFPSPQPPQSPQLQTSAQLVTASSNSLIAPPPSIAPTAATTTTTGNRCILNNISGQVFSGQITAILGPSGVGKTSLLNSLTGRNTMDGTGRVSLIGANNSKRMSVVTVPQVDVLPNKLTAHEDLHFTSRLKNPQARFDHQRNIDRLVKHLHMDKFLHTKIDKLSGGEARRLSIARELLSSPDIMILDEPTSGLDANTCKKIITALRDIVEHSDNILDKPMSIIITIHQPQQEVFQLFHRVYVMAIGGRVVFEGSPQLLMPTVLEYSSISRICPVEQLNENPAIVAIEVASGEYGNQVIEELALHHEAQVYEEFSCFTGSQAGGGGGPGSFGALESPMLTPRSLKMHKSPMSVSRFDVQLHRKRLNSLGDGSIGRPTPILAKRQLTPTATSDHVAKSNYANNQWDRVSNITSVSYASTYDADLPEQISKLKVDKRLRRSVVMKSHFINHTLTLIRRCWLLTTRDIFLMSIRILGFLLVAGGTVQIFSHALDPDEHQCPQFESEIDDMPTYLGQVRGRLMGLLEMLRQGNSTHLFFFHLLLCITMVTSALTGLVFPLQMRMFIREYKNGWYSPASFIMSQTIAELPADIIGPLITLLITYPLCHQPDSLYHWRLIGYALILVLSSIICKSQAQIVGAFLMDSVENSVFISCVAVTPPALLSGIPLRIDQMIAPLKLVSYGSFLRYAFEGLLELRYGFGMCPCDATLIHGPLKASLQAVPPHLENLATGLLELSLPTNQTTRAGDFSQNTALAAGGSGSPQTISEHENVFLKFLRLVTDAGNMFTNNGEINDCERYRSLYLINMGIQNNTFIEWIVVMVLMFIISRFLTYFAVKAVIKLRRR
uniref:ATP-binding cassette sub-family G member 1 n=1 Tax=Aceria tosichella TaxID=561515 RepID=A0A6G1SKG1_9ACAR